MKLQNVLFSLLISTSVISNAMADTSFLQTQVSFNHIYETAKRTNYEQIFNSDFIFLLYPYSKNDKWLIQDIAQACVNYTTVNKEITRDTCKNFVKDIIGIEETDSTIVKTEETNVPTIKDGKFVLTTTTDTTEFKFTINAPGEYIIDCGNSTQLTGGSAKYICAYTDAGQYNITVTGHATDYTDDAAISFANNTKLAKISGSLGSVFPTLSDKQPIFHGTFAGCTALTEIPADLFSGISGAPAEDMFVSTFSGCTALTEIPAGLFSTINGIAPGMFWSTFTGCTGLKSIPEKLFENIKGEPADSMFAGTFEACTALTEIPAGLFSSISGKPATNMFNGTFMGCTGLTSIPDNLFSTISGEPAENMFWNTFEACTALTEIPADLFSTISGAPADSMFAGTFSDCTGLKSIPASLFSKIDGTPAPHMFNGTFSGCTSLTEIPAGLFSSISGTPATYMFAFTFQDCTNLTSIPENLFSTISGAPAENMFRGTFWGCTGLTSIPENLFSTISGAPATSMFNSTFWDCTGLTSIPAGLFSTISGTPADSMFTYTFKDCTSLESIPEKLFENIKGKPADSMFAGTFEGCTKLTGTITPEFFGTITPPITQDYLNQENTFEGTGITSVGKFVLTTTANTSNFKFKINAPGEYIIDCGNGTQLTGGSAEYECAYTNADQYNITVTGQATDYTNDAAISFKDNTNLAKISGSLGSVFPTLSDKQPTFQNTFAGCTALTEIPADLFSGISGTPAADMFNSTFSGCTSLTEIPAGLFSGISGVPADFMFAYTFKNCTGLTSIPDDLFSGISGAYADSMFRKTFSSCTGLTGTITPEFFGAITPQITQEYLNSEDTFDGASITYAPSTNSNADNRFVLTTTADTTEFTFRILATGDYNVDCGNNKTATKNSVEYTYTCKYDNADQYDITVTGRATDYLNERPAISFKDNTNLAKISGSLGSVFPTLSNKQPIFHETFYGCTGLTEIPAGLFSGISGTPAKNMFDSTFAGCTALKEIPAGLFSTISGTPALGMFDSTFSGCTGLTEIPAGLFSTISGTPAIFMFSDTFNGCTGLTEIPAGLFSGISGAPASFMFWNTFLGCTGLKEIPAGLFSGISGVPAEDMFDGTFAYCKSLTSIPAGLFSTISGTPAKRMFARTFWNCTGLTKIPDDLFSTISGAPAEDMFEYTFHGCTGLTGTITPKFFGNITPPITQDYLILENTFKDANITYQTTSNSAD